jgi:excisionase family DNA binding protein
LTRGEKLDTLQAEMKKSQRPNNTKQTKQLFMRSSLTTGEAARHCQVTTPAIKRWIQDGRLAAFRTPGGHLRIETKEFQRFLHEYGMPAFATPRPELRILIADDEPGVVDMLVDYLSSDPRGFKLETATDGYLALVKVGDFKPSLLILDLAMPHVNGVQVCRRLKAAPETRAIKILGITGFANEVPALTQAGADACLAKPLNLRRLTGEIERLLELPPAARQWKR